MNRPSRARFVHRVDVLEYDPEATDATGSLLRGEGTVILASVACLITDKGGGRGPYADREQETKKGLALFPDFIDLRQKHALKYTPPQGRVRFLLVDSIRDDQDLGRLWVATWTEWPDPNANGTP